PRPGAAAAVDEPAVAVADLADAVGEHPRAAVGERGIGRDQLQQVHLAGAERDTGEVNLLELVSAYAPFANGGTGVLAYGIGEIRDSDGRLVYRRSGSGPG